MKIIPLANGGEAIVDDKDFDSLIGFTWRQRKDPHTSYAFTVKRPHNLMRHTKPTKGNLKYILMHRFILGLTDPEIQVDHKNHNGLDNRRENIKPCTRKENMANRRIKKKLSLTS